MDSHPTEQETSMTVELQKEHQWLQKLVGEWSYESEVSMGADQPPAKGGGIERVRSVGLWTLAEGQGEMPGCGAVTTMMTLGYDPQKQRFVGTWLGSIMTNLWLYEGELDETETVLTLNTEGPAMSGDGTMARYQDVIELKSADHRVLTSRTLGEDGQWKPFMMANYRRQT
jgi:Protein of unknown function (DUF1579)